MWTEPKYVSSGIEISRRLFSPHRKKAQTNHNLHLSIRYYLISA
ncbi:MAG: hypothetical protein O3C32_02805 [Bacteroidetes bacterium]|nr:hypothetical protein [Bacteroidota bacterium]